MELIEHNSALTEKKASIVYGHRCFLDLYNI